MPSCWAVDAVSSRGVDARPALDPVHLERDRDVLALRVGRIGAQGVAREVGEGRRTVDALPDEDDLVVADAQGIDGEELQLVEALVLRGVVAGQVRDLGHRGEIGLLQRDLLAVEGEVPVGAVEQLHRLAGQQRRGIERAGEVDPDRQGRGAERRRRPPGRWSGPAGRWPAEPGVGGVDLQLEIAGAPRQAAAGELRMEIRVAVAADRQVVSPLPQDLIERGDAAVGLAVDLVEQAMAVEVVEVPVVVAEGVVIEQAEDAVERRGGILAGDLELDACGSAQREGVPDHIGGALGPVADRARLPEADSGADQPQLRGLVHGLVRDHDRREAEGSHQAPELEPLDPRPRRVPTRLPRPRRRSSSSRTARFSLACNHR